MNRLSQSAVCHFLLSLVLGELVAAGVAVAQEVPPNPRTEGPAPEAAPLSRREGVIPRGNLLTVPIGGTQPLQMSRKQVIQTVVNEKDNVATVSPRPNDPTTINITGREAGTTRLTLTAADQSVEQYEVIVQADIEYLRTVLRRVVPTANLDLIPATAGTIIIGGTVARSEDIQMILETATGLGMKVINSMRVEEVVQVQLDVVLATVARNDARTFGFNFLEQSGNGKQVLSGTIFPPTLPNAMSGQMGAAPSIPVVAPPGTNVIFGLQNNGNAFFGFLQALRTEGLAKILAEPKLVTLSGRSAHFHDGGQQALPTFSAGGQGGAVGGISFSPFGIDVSFLPIIMGDGKVYLEIDASNSILSAANAAAAAPVPGAPAGSPTVSGRNDDAVHTSVVMEDGQTFAVGGLIEHTVNGTTQKLPVLGDLPYIGVLFSQKNYSESENEVLILVTPHLVDPMACDQVPKIFPGQETRRPDDYELFLEGIMEAPRGQREVFPGNHYLPAYKNGPTAALLPCGGSSCQGPQPGQETVVGYTPVPGPATKPPPVMQPSEASNRSAPQQGMPLGDAFSNPAPQPVPSRKADLLPSTNPRGVPGVSGFNWPKRGPATHNQAYPGQVQQASAFDN